VRVGACLLVGVTSACSLAIGDIELPEDAPPGGEAPPSGGSPVVPVTDDGPKPGDALPIDAEALQDAAVDAAWLDTTVTPSDAGPPVDIWEGDAQLPVDEGPPAPDLPVLPPQDLSPWLGDWRMYGLVEVAGALEPYEATLSIDFDRAHLSDSRGRERQVVALFRIEDGSGTLGLELPEVGPMRGALAVLTGAGVFSPEPTAADPPVAALFVSRLQSPPPPLPESMVYDLMGRSPREGQGELGVMLLSGDSYAVRSRLVVGVADTLPDATWIWQQADASLYEFADVDTGALVRFAPNSQGTGGVGLGVARDGTPDSVMLGLSGAASPVGPRPGPLHCGGITLPAQGLGHRALSLAAVVEAGLLVSWEGGGQQTFEPSQSVYTMRGGPSPFDIEGGIGLHDRFDETLLFLPAQAGGRLYWGALMCVRTDLLVQ
jgi:hypothetical protein